MTRLNNKITVIISLAPPDFRPFHRPLRRIRPLLHALSLADTRYAPSIFDKSGHLLCALVFILLFGTFGIFRPLCKRTSRLLSLSGLPTLLPRALPVSATSVSENHGESRFIQSRDSPSAPSLVSGDDERTPFPPPKRCRDRFFQSYLALSVVALFYIVGHAWKKTTLQWGHQIH